MTFLEVCHECISNKELITHWNRLTGNKLGTHRDPITTLIDKACGYDPDMEAMPDFINFVYEYIWLPLRKTL